MMNAKFYLYTLIIEISLQLTKIRTYVAMFLKLEKVNPRKTRTKKVSKLHIHSSVINVYANKSYRSKSSTQSFWQPFFIEVSG